jgi:hypothetical protein
MADLNHQIRRGLLIARRCCQPLLTVRGSRPVSPASAARVRCHCAPATPNNRTTGALSRSGVTLRHRPRFNAVCPSLPAANPQTTAINAGTFIAAMLIAERVSNATLSRQ